MTTTETISKTIPLTAWEQIAVVCLFSIIFVFLVAYLLRWFSKQQTQWQVFTKERDTFWQSWLEKANCDTTAGMKTVTEALVQVNNSMHSLSISMQGIANQISEHDDKVDDKFDHAVKVVKETFTGANGKQRTERRKPE